MKDIHERKSTVSYRRTLCCHVRIDLKTPDRCDGEVVTSLVCDDVSVCDEGKVTVDAFSLSDFTAKIFWLASPHLLDECCSGDLLISL